jgi:uncharacterized protein
VDFQDLSARIEAAGGRSGPPEAQGMLCGLLCGGATDPLGTWLGEMLPDAYPEGVLDMDLDQDLCRLAAETREAIEGSGLGFTPLLPPDEAPLGERAAALRDWCQGFLYGLGLAGAALEQLSAETAEALRDLAQIAQLDAAGISGSEEDEESYTELAELSWVVAMLIHAECASEGPLS